MKLKPLTIQNAPVDTKWSGIKITFILTINITMVTWKGVHSI